MERDGETVGLITDPLEQEQPLRTPRKADGKAVAGPVHLFESLGQGRDLGDVGQRKSVEDVDDDPELAQPTVDEQQVGRAGEAPPPTISWILSPAAHASFEDLCHGGEVVIALDGLDLEVPVRGLDRKAVFEHHH